MYYPFHLHLYDVEFFSTKKNNALLPRIHDSTKLSLETAVTFYIMGFHEKISYLKEIITVHFVIMKSILLIPKKCMRMYYYCAKQ